MRRRLPRDKFQKGKEKVGQSQLFLDTRSNQERGLCCVDRLAMRLKEDPGNGEGWAMLARSYKHFGRYEESARAYRNAVSRLAPDAPLLVRAAEGSRMPLAMLRKQARDLPAAFSLDDTTAMAAGITLSQ